MSLATPAIHDNGTSRADLSAGYNAARWAVGNALTLLRDVAPNARDYQGGDDFNAAMVQHRERDRWLREVRYELDLLASHCGG